MEGEGEGHFASGKSTNLDVRFSTGKNERAKEADRTACGGTTLFNRRIYEDPSLAFIETSGGRAQGKANGSARANSCVRVCVLRRIRHAIKFEQTSERERGGEDSRGLVSLGERIDHRILVRNKSTKTRISISGLRRRAISKEGIGILRMCV